MQTQLSFSPMYTKALDAKSRSVEATLSSETVDGHGEIVDQGSWRLDRYRKNPIVLYMHSPWEVVGHAENIRVVDGKLQARILFATTKQADEVFTLFRDGAMRAFSVGFRAGRVEQVQLSGRSVRKLLDCELYEVSAVSMPSNPDAVTKHKALGLVPASFSLREHARQHGRAKHGAELRIAQHHAGSAARRSGHVDGAVPINLASRLGRITGGAA